MSSPRELGARLAAFGKLRSQPISEWQGPVALPESVARMYADSGPWGDLISEAAGRSGLDIPCPGGPLQIPPLSKLWNWQEGYRWDALTGETSPSWDDGWIVVALQNSDPFVLDGRDGSVTLRRHGADHWGIDVVTFPDLEQMLLCFVVQGEVVELADEELFDDDFGIQPLYRTLVRDRLIAAGWDSPDATIDGLGWDR